MGCIYVAINKVNGKKYVGQTTRAVCERKAEHFKKTRCRAIAAAIRKYGAASFEWKILHDGILSKDELNRLEVQEISRLRTHAPNGYNLTAGGDGFDWDDPAFRERHRSAINRVCRTPEHRAKISAAVKLSFLKPGYREKMREAMVLRSQGPWKENHRRAIEKRTATESWRENNATGQRRRSENPEWRKNHAEAMARTFGKPVLCAETGTTYESAREAFRRTGVSWSSISQHLRGRSKSAGGFHWRFAT